MADLVAPGTDVEVREIAGAPGFGFTAVGIERLGSAEYTLVTIAVDLTGSTEAFAPQLRDMLIAAVEACRETPASENLMVRVIGFSTSLPGGIKEFHGFVPLSTIDTSAYPTFDPWGMTPLNDASFSTVGAMVDYGRDLRTQEYPTNAIGFVITDGCDNDSIHTAADVKRRKQQVRGDEELESLMMILIGINAAKYKKQLEQFTLEAGFDKYIDAGQVTSTVLARLANFVKQSVSSTSQARGTGGPSQNISATI